MLMQESLHGGVITGSQELHLDAAWSWQPFSLYRSSCFTHDYSRSGATWIRTRAGQSQRLYRPLSLTT